MVSFLRKLKTSYSVPSMEIEDSLSNSYEYSFAVIYNGPPLDHSIPEIPVFKIDQIPIAPIVHENDNDNDFSVPIGKLHHKNKHRQKHKKNTSDSTVYPNLEPHVVEIEPSKSDFDVNESRTSDLASSRIVCDVSIESSSNSSFGCSEICSINEDDEQHNSDESETLRTTKHVKRPSAVTFRDPESNYMAETESCEFIYSHNVGSGSVPLKPHAIRPGKKGSCYKCLRGNSLTEKEVCIVCSAKYCRNCVIRAMGSMPQGRKCVDCIGYGIDENKRRKLGKCSKMLKKLLSETIVDQVMNDERVCEANQMPSNLVQVNLQPLNREQLKLLLNCRNPPKQLKPGSYWYDKASGFWGKIGQPPCQIISPRLDVGGRLDRNASNGNTNVTINDREITKKELLILKMAGVPCEGTPNFWVNADGSYREEGQKNDRGRIWDKIGTKVACAIFSLPVPSKSVTSNDEGETANKLSLCNKNVLRKFLLLGSVNSGACTIFKQAKLLYNAPFSENDLQNIKLVILSNLFTYLGILLEGREEFEEEILVENRKRWPSQESTSSGNSSEHVDTTPYSIGPRLKNFSDWLLKCMLSGNLDAIFPAAIREYGPMVEYLWRDEAIKATYNRRNELKMLPRSANYFLDRAIEISKVDYQPSDMDILYAEGMSLSNNLTSMDFSFPKSSREECLHPEYQHDSSLRYQLIRVHPTCLGEKCKWLEMFEDTDVVLFSVSLTDYDDCIIDTKGVSTNKMLASKNLFENIIAHPTFKKKKFLLILTKFDLLEEKIAHVPLTRCEWFCDFKPVISHNQNKFGNSGTMPSLAQSAFQYIAVKFKRLFHSITDRILFVSLVTGLEPDTIDEALRYGREVMEWENWNTSISNDKSENTSTSLEDPSSA
ncbi:extra-large guanine nucleotide-binding protein 1-like isoform X2 [Cicer arietinum]|uniref:Extra-large guanine nucleotide-binding protein 1-like isoform X2 n=1 Tax=Cicer arietinum TaxID=3827 RepID=A0A1S2Y3Z6_CICAR|nr:extra-large guanine nucleotide-binding protein 1-like isoform X2 [Cicer arietinum]